MVGLFDDYKNVLFKKDMPDKGMLVPLLIWTSANPNSIEICQKINRKFFKCPSAVLLQELYFNCSPRITKYPKGTKEDKKTLFFYLDIAKYFGWTKNELYKNLSIIDVDSMKEEIAQKFGYSNMERRAIKLKKIKGTKLKE